MAAAAPLVEVFLYVQQDTNSTKHLQDHLNHYIGELTREVRIKIIRVTPQTIKQIRARHNIARTPCLVVRDRMVYDINEIKRYLTPQRAAVATFAGAMGADEQWSNYMQTFTDPSVSMAEEEEDHFDTDKLKQRIHDLNKNRASTTAPKRRPAQPAPMATFQGDDGFIAAAGVDNVEDTPTQPYFSEQDGERMLEDYKLEVAKSESGYKTPSNKMLKGRGASQQRR